jgi:chromatin segregation and condensation protein Rec8/ScpA/Scc1 (kleisin family)
MIGLFLAMLELVRQRKVVVRQDAVNARIVLTLAPETTEEQQPA